MAKRTVTKLSTEARRKLLRDKAHKQSEVAAQKKPRKQYTRKIKDPGAPDTPAPIVETPPAPVVETPPAPVVETPPAPIVETPPAVVLSAEDIQREIDEAFTAHNSVIKDFIPVTPLDTPPAPPADPQAVNNPAPAVQNFAPSPGQVTAATNEANEALARLVDPELIIMGFDLLLSNILAVVLRKFARFDVKSRDFQLSGSERNDLGKLLTAYIKTRNKMMVSPGWAMAMGAIGVYLGKGINLIDVKKIAPPAPPAPEIKPEEEQPQIFTVQDQYLQMMQKQNEDLLNTLNAMQRKIETLETRTKKTIRSQAAKGNKGGRKKRADPSLPPETKDSILKFHGS